MPGAWSLDSCRSPQINSQVKLVTYETWLTNTIFDSERNPPGCHHFLKVRQLTSFRSDNVCNPDTPMPHKRKGRNIHTADKSDMCTPSGAQFEILAYWERSCWCRYWMTCSGWYQAANNLRPGNTRLHYLRYHILVSKISLMYDLCVRTKENDESSEREVREVSRLDLQWINIAGHMPWNCMLRCPTNPRDQVMIGACAWYPCSWPEQNVRPQV